MNMSQYCADFVTDINHESEADLICLIFSINYYFNLALKKSLLA